jgi:lincosamide nucleotidyltransferase A/C/D/E
MDQPDVVALQRLLKRNGLDWWVVGGWGVDAILGSQTRPHKDLDVLIAVEQLPALRAVLHESGYRLTLLWDENRWHDEGNGSDEERATAFVLTDRRGREIDVHVLDVSSAGIRPLWATDRVLAVQDLAWRGAIGDEEVACLSCAAQLRFHRGYDLPDTHAADVQLLQAYVARSTRSWPG